MAEELTALPQIA